MEPDEKSNGTAWDHLATSVPPTRVPAAIRNRILAELEGGDGTEDSEEWIRRIVADRKNVPEREFFD